MSINEEFKEFLDILNLGEIHFYRTYHPCIYSSCNSYKLITPMPNGDGAGKFRIEICPGDTTKQSKSLYEIDRSEELTRLETLGWSILTNFHFAFMSQNLLWTSFQGNWKDYVLYWHNECSEGSIRQYKRSEWDKLLEKLCISRNMTETDIARFTDRILKKAYLNVNLCPSIKMTYSINWKDLESDEPEVYRNTRKLLKETERVLG